MRVMVSEAMGNWWVVFSVRAAGSVVGGTEAQARTLASSLGAVTSVHRLPYPRYPVLNPAQDQCPAFCYGHAECFGKTACPHRHACSE